MNTDKESSSLFANEKAILWIVSISKIVSWVILVLYVIAFASSVYGITQRQLPNQFFQAFLTMVEALFPLVQGLFFFLVLQGVAHGLNLGLDIYYDFQPEEEYSEEENEDEEEVVG